MATGLAAPRARPREVIEGRAATRGRARSAAAQTVLLRWLPLPPHLILKMLEQFFSMIKVPAAELASQLLAAQRPRSPVRLPSPQNSVDRRRTPHQPPLTSTASRRIGNAQRRRKFHVMRPLRRHRALVSPQMTPTVIVPRPRKYFVTLWTTRCAPSANRLTSKASQKMLSTIKIAPTYRVGTATAAISSTSNLGLLIYSTNTTVRTG